MRHASQSEKDFPSSTFPFHTCNYSRRREPTYGSRITFNTREERLYMFFDLMPETEMFSGAGYQAYQSQYSADNAVRRREALGRGMSGNHSKYSPRED